MTPEDNAYIITSRNKTKCIVFFHTSIYYLHVCARLTLQQRLLKITTKVYLIFSLAEVDSNITLSREAREQHFLQVGV